MDDLISRQVALDAFDGVKVDEENCTEYDIVYNDGIDFAISKLSVLPPAQPEGEKDEWIEAWVSGYPAIHHRRCNTFIYAPNGKRGYNFCPRCGYPMKGDVE